MKKTPVNWNKTAKILHWGIGFLFISLLIVGLLMGYLPNTPLKGDVYGLHKAFGVTILALVLFRLIWRLTHASPSLPKQMVKWQKVAAEANVALLYLLMVGVPLSGFIMSSFGGRPISYFGLFTIPPLMTSPHPLGKLAHSAHSILSYIIIGLLVLHILAALYHHFVLKDNVLKRMWF